VSLCHIGEVGLVVGMSVTPSIARWTLRRWPREDVCIFGSLASSIALVVVHFFDCVDGEERMTGDHGVDGASEVEAPKA
jgi:hypothetical protein